jgi:hypothetical protein
MRSIDCNLSNGIRFSLATVVLTLLMVPEPGWATTAPWLAFEGPSPGYVEVPHDPALSPDSAITVEAWVYLLDGFSGPGGSCPTFVGKNWETGYWFGVCRENLRLYPQGNNPIDSDGSVPIGEWCHVAATFDGAEVRFYLNGVLDSTVPVTGSLTPNTEPLRIGSDVAWNHTPNGAIDEVRLWDVARSEAEIAATMNSVLTSPLSGLVAVWSFSNGATDPIGGHDGEIFGDAAIGNAFPGTDSSCDWEYFVPAGAHAAGELGSLWITDMTLRNRTSNYANVEIFLLVRDQDNTNAVSITDLIAGETALALPDLILDRFGEDSLASAFRICADESLQVSTRTYNQSAGGTFGQGIPGVISTSVGSSAVYLIALYENAQFRTNVGFVNTSDQPGTVTISFYDGSSTLLATQDYDLLPYEYRQRGKIFREVTSDPINNGWVRVTASGTEVIAYASVVDNSTGDGTYMQAEP